MCELDYKKGWIRNNWCFQIVVLEKTLESAVDYKKIKPVNLKGNQPWIFIGRTDIEAETPTLWPPDAKSWLTGKDCDAGKDRRQKVKRATEDEMVGWHHQFNRHELGKTPGDSEWQKPAVLQSMGSQSWTCLGDWTTTTCGEKGASYTIGRNVNWCSRYRK